MPRSPTLTRLKGRLYPFIEQNDVSDAVLTGPADVLGVLDATLEAYLLDGRYLEPGTVTITAGTNVITQVPDAGQSAVDWTMRFQVGDEIAVGGSIYNQSARYVASTVTATTITATGAPFTTTETGLVYAKPTFGLWRRCQELGLYPGGYESDSDLRTNVLERWLDIQAKRGSRGGLTSELNRVINSSINLLESVLTPTTLETGAAYTATTKALDNANGWATGLPIGSAITILGSAAGSNGRYSIVGTASGAPVIGHRATRARKYASITPAGAVDVQLREDRELNQLWVRLVNTTDTNAAVTLTFTLTNATWASGLLTAGTGSASVTSTVATATLTPAAGMTTEMMFVLSGVVSSPAPVLTAAITSGAPTGVRIGELGLFPTEAGGTTNFSATPQWTWGGYVWTGIRSGVNESGLTILGSALPTWYLEVSTPGQIEEDAYTMASPDEFVVIEADHRNRRNYADADLKVLVKEVFMPADTDYVLALV